VSTPPRPREGSPPSEPPRASRRIVAYVDDCRALAVEFGRIVAYTDDSRALAVEFGSIVAYTDDCRVLAFELGRNVAYADDCRALAFELGRIVAHAAVVRRFRYSFATPGGKSTSVSGTPSRSRWSQFRLRT